MQIISNVQMKQMLEAGCPAADGPHAADGPPAVDGPPFIGMDGTYINARWKNGVYRVAGLVIRGEHREAEFFDNLMDAVQWAKEREAEGHGYCYPEI